MLTNKKYIEIDENNEIKVRRMEKVTWMAAIPTKDLTVSA